MEDLVRTLNERGIQKLMEYLEELRQGSTRQPPTELLIDPSFSSKLPGGIEVENRIFDSKLDLAKYLFEKFRILPQSQIEKNKGLWSWLSLYYFDQLCPKSRSGGRIPGKDYRYILVPDFRYYYRHLLVGPYNIFRLHGERAPLLLYGLLNEMSKHYLELSCRQGFVTNKGIMETANLLYFDAASGRPKRGAAVATRKPGSLFRFIDVVQQLDLTYDLYSMSGEEVLALLPSEFDQWHPYKV